MKPTSILLNTFLLVTSWNAYAQADSCFYFFPIQKGEQLEFETFNSKDKSEGVEFFSVKSEYDDAMVFEHIQQDKKERDRAEPYKFEIFCEGDSFFIDMREALAPLYKKYGEEDFEVDMGYRAFPKQLVADKELPDAESFWIMPGEEDTVTIKVKVVSRKILSKKEVETPMGPLSCIRIDEKVKIYTKPDKIEFKQRLYIAEGYGIVKIERKDKEGKLEEYIVRRK